MERASIQRKLAWTAADIKSEGTTAASTTQMGDAILKELQKLHA